MCLLPRSSDASLPSHLGVPKPTLFGRHVSRLRRVTDEIVAIGRGMTHGDLFRQMGIARMEFATGPGNRIAVSGETNNLDAYMKIYNSPATAEAMAFDGVKRETVQMFGTSAFA